MPGRTRLRISPSDPTAANLSFPTANAWARGFVESTVITRALNTTSSSSALGFRIGSCAKRGRVNRPAPVKAKRSRRVGRSGILLASNVEESKIAKLTKREGRIAENNAPLTGGKLV